MRPLREFPFGRELLIVAHRGASGEAPENTMAAFDLAIAEGAMMIELDVQRTTDDRLVVFHDSTLRRTTKGRGRVAEKSHRELHALDAGSWFDARFAGERIPLLDDVLEHVRNRAYLNIEVKSSAVRDGTAELLVRAIHRHHAADRVLLSSFHHGVVKRIKELAPDIPTAVILHPTKSVVNVVRVARRANADAIVCATYQLTRKRVRDAASHGMPLTVYTVNTPFALKRVLRYGVQIVVTNFPGKIGKAARAHHAARHA